MSAPTRSISEFSSLSDIYLNVDDSISIDFDTIDDDDINGMIDADKEVVKDINAMTTRGFNIGEIDHFQCKLEKKRYINK